MQFPFISNNSKKIVAIFDVGSDSIGVCIVKYPSPHEAPKILKTFREGITFRDQLDFMVFMEDMIKALKLSALRASSSGVGSISDIHIVLSSPWYVSENRHIVLSDKAPFTFTEKLSNELIAKEIDKLKNIHHEKYGGNLDDFNVLEKEIVQVSLNGYPIVNPIGKRTSSVDMNMIVTLSSGTCLSLVKENISAAFHDAPLYFHSNMSAVFLVIREKYEKMNSYMIIDIGGEITDMIIVNDSTPEIILSFPYGRQSLYRELKKDLNKSISEISSLLSLYLNDALEDKERLILDKSLLKVQKSWTSEFENALSSIPEPRMIPNSVFLVINKDVHPFFFKMFSEKNELIYKIFKNDCNVLGLSGPDFLGVCSVEDGSCDPMLMIQALVVKRKYIK